MVEAARDEETMTALLLALPMALVGCMEEARLDGQVVDIWGNPVEGATVVMEGQSERPLTDASGRFSLPYAPGTHKMKAGREGYIQQHVTVEIAEGGEPPHPVFELYPKPEEAGFYVVSTSDYARLGPVVVLQVGNDIDSVRGIRTIGENVVDAEQLRVLFHTTLKMDQVMRLGLQLHKLQYVAESEMTGALAPTLVPVNLWKSVGTVPLDIAPMRSRNDYLVTTTEAIEPGAYAFDTQGLLTAGDTTEFLQVPEPLRVAYPFELR